MRPAPGADAPDRDRFTPTYGTVAAIGFVLWGLSLGLSSLGDNSFLTHLATGRLILDTTSIPDVDPFSYTAVGEDWVVQSWLPATLYAALERLGGATLLRAGFALQICGLVLVVWLLAGAARSLLPRIAAVALAVAVGVGIWSERPLLIGLLGLGMSLLSTRATRWPWWLVPVFWVWANSHGSFPLGVLVLGLLVVGSRLDGQPTDGPRRALTAALGGVALAFVNPLGPKLLVFPVQLLSRHDVLSNVTEWQSPTFQTTWQRIFLLQVALAVLALVRRPSWRSGLLVAFAIGISLLALRNVAVGSLLLVPVLAEGFGDLGSLRVDGRLPLGRPLVVTMGLLAAVVLAGGLDRDDYDLGRYPVRAVAYLQAEGFDVRRERVLSHDYVGNYLEAIYGEQANVYLDDRFDMYPTEVSDDYLALLRVHSNWEDALDRSRAEVVLWSVQQPLTQLLERHPSWRLAYRDDRFAVFLRRGGDAA